MWHLNFIVASFIIIADLIVGPFAIIMYTIEKFATHKEIPISWYPGPILLWWLILFLLIYRM